MKLWLLLAIILGMVFVSAWACDNPPTGPGYTAAARMVLTRSLSEAVNSNASSAPDTMYVAYTGLDDPPAEVLQNLQFSNLVVEPWSKCPNGWYPNTAGFTFPTTASQDTVKAQFNWIRVSKRESGARSGGNIYGGAAATVVRNGDAWEIVNWKSLGVE